MMERMTMAKHDKTVQLQALKADTTGFMVTDAQPELVRLRVGKGLFNVACEEVPPSRLSCSTDAGSRRRTSRDAVGRKRATSVRLCR